MGCLVKQRKKVGVSAITLAEVIYLSEKQRIPPGTLQAMLSALRRPDGALQEAPVDADVVVQMQSFSRDDIPDMPDRIIAATALRYNIPVISRDQKIRTANLATVLVSGEATVGNIAPLLYLCAGSLHAKNSAASGIRAAA